MNLNRTFETVPSIRLWIFAQKAAACRIHKWLDVIVMVNTRIELWPNGGLNV